MSQPNPPAEPTFAATAAATPAEHNPFGQPPSLGPIPGNDVYARFAEIAGKMAVHLAHIHEISTSPLWSDNKESALRMIENTAKEALHSVNLPEEIASVLRMVYPTLGL